MTRRQVRRSGWPARAGRFRRARRGWSSAGLMIAIVGMSLAAPAAADTVDQLGAAVAAARATSCGPLRDDPIVQQTAYEVNKSTDVWLDHGSRAVPVPDALPLLKDLGYEGSKSAILYGAGKNEADSIKTLLLQGYQKIPDCSYSDYGASVLQGNSAGWILSIVVLAG